MGGVPRRAEVLELLGRLEPRIAEGVRLAGDRMIGPVEPWRFVGSYGEPAFLNGWTNVGGGGTDLAFYMDESALVWMKGQITNPTAVAAGAPIFYLPGPPGTSYRPAYRTDGMAATDQEANSDPQNVWGEFVIETDGAVRKVTGGVVGLFSLDNTVFIAVP